jgi:hypothetical protein
MGLFGASPVASRYDASLAPTLPLEPAMSSDPTPGNPGNPNQPNFDSGFITGEFRHQQLSARVPEPIGKGVFSTGGIVLSTANEFILDFLCRMARPHTLAARVIIAPSVMPSILAVIRDNVGKYQAHYGPIPPLPKPETERKPTIQEIYDDLKLGDEVLCGAYANGLMLGHTPAEFCFDFLTNFFPKSAVAARVFLSVPHVPRMLDSLTQTFNAYQQKQAGRQGSPPPGPQGPEPMPPQG